MRCVSRSACVLTLAACIQQPANAARPRSPVLPTKFILLCSAPSQVGPNLTLGTANGFKVSVNLSSKRFSAPWYRRWQPIKLIRPDEIVFVDYHVKRGLDNNPMQQEMRFEVPTGQLIYRNIYAALTYVNEGFSARCKVLPNG